MRFPGPGVADEAERFARLSAQRRVNTELISLYWSIGDTILQRQAQDEWGSQIVGRLAEDLRAEFPAMKGFRDRISSTCAPLRKHGRVRSK